MHRYLRILLCLVWGCSANMYGNVGVFRGAGTAVTLGKNSEIQMVEETVIMTPVRGNFPIDGNCRNQDQMKYRCLFKLRNLSDKIVTVPVGFPLSSEAVWFSDPEKIDQSEIIARFGFVAGTKDRTFPIRYVPWDKKKKFSNLFLWEMTFAPHEEIELKVLYTMGGYLGLAATSIINDGTIVYQCKYLNLLEYAMGQGHIYITGTGSSWAGRIEKATFRIYPYEFEEYLRQRGPCDNSENTRQKKTHHKKMMASKKYDESVLFGTLASTPLRKWTPAFEKWKKISLPNARHERESYWELVYEPFEPKEKDQLYFFYLFPVMPVNAADFDLLLKVVKQLCDKKMTAKKKFMQRLDDLQKSNPAEYERLKKNTPYFEQAIPYSETVRRNLADVVLEFYGISTGNAAIQDFLKNQCWYPVKDPKAIDPELESILRK